MTPVNTLTSFHASINNGELGDTVVQAETIDGAWREAISWARQGAWEGEVVTVNLRVYAPGEEWPSEPARNEQITFQNPE